MKKLRVGDEVIVLTGKDRRRVGEIQRFVGKDRVVVGGIQMAKKHKAQTREGEPYGIIDKELPIHISNVAIFNHQTNKADKVLVKVNENQKRTRVFKSSDEPIELN